MPTAAIAMGTRVQPTNTLGGVNPMEMMHQMFELRNMQQQWNANTEAGQVLATSPDIDTAIDQLTKGPNAAWQIPMINQLREQQRTMAQIGQVQAETARTHLGTGVDALHAAISMSADPFSLAQNIAHAKSRLDPGVAKETGGLFDDTQTSLTANLPPDPAAALREYQQRVIALKIGSGQATREAYGGLGYPEPQIVSVPDPQGGPARPWQLGGIPGAGGPGPLTPQPSTGAQLEQTKTLEERQKALATDVNAGNSVMQNINKVEELLTKFDTSSLTDRRSSWAGLAQALGADQKQIDEIAGGDLSSIQEANKYLYGTLIQRMDTAMPPGGRLNLPTTNAFMAAHPTIGMQEKAIKDIFDGWRRAQVTNVMQQRILGRYMNENAHVPGAAGMWPDHWQGIIQRKGLNDPHYYIPGSTTEAIPPSVILDLLANDTPAVRKKIDDKYGPGTSARFLEDQ
jgi:hypothetical protein